MKRSFSIAEARNRFTQLVYDAESGIPIEVTRRGKPVAIVMSIGDYGRLTKQSPSFFAAAARFRDSLRDDELADLADAFIQVRDGATGREVNL